MVWLAAPIRQSWRPLLFTHNPKSVSARVIINKFNHIFLKQKSISMNTVQYFLQCLSTSNYLKIISALLLLLLLVFA